MNNLPTTGKFVWVLSVSRRYVIGAFEEWEASIEYVGWRGCYEVNVTAGDGVEYKTDGVDVIEGMQLCDDLIVGKKPGVGWVINSIN